MKKYKSIWLTGQPGSGKTTLANLLVKELNVEDEKYFNIDGDDLRDLFQNTYTMYSFVPFYPSGIWSWTFASKDENFFLKGQNKETNTNVL